MRPDRNTTLINIFLIILLLASLAVIFYLLYNYYLSTRPAGDPGSGLQNVALDQPDDQNPDSTSESGPINTNSQMATFSYSYPSGWTVEENVEADFTTIRNDRDENIVTIRVAKKPDSLQNLPFSDYVKVAAINEIQGFEELVSDEAITTEFGDTGYLTIWKIQFLGGEEINSNPITYFEHPFDPSKSIQVNLENGQYQKEYNLIINSFEIK